MAANSSQPCIEHYGDQFRQFENSLNGGATTAVHQVRRDALDHLRSEGFPTHRDEAWRHTNPATLTQSNFGRATADATLDEQQITPWMIAGLDTGPRLVFVNGRFDAGWSRLGTVGDGIQIRPLAAAIGDDDPILQQHLGSSACHREGGFGALNTAFMEDGVLIEIGEDRNLDTPIEIIYVTRLDEKTALVTPRTLVVVATGGKLQFVETFVSIGAGDHLTAPVTEIIVGKDAQVDHVRIQGDADGSRHAAVLHVREAENSRFTSHSIGLGGALVRNDVTTVIDGEGVESTLNGLFLTCGTEHVDNYTSIEHAAPNSSSHELYKGILADRAHNVFRGKIHVHQVAQQTDAYQSNQNLLLSDDAEIMSKPQLEIYADDVKCSHGSTTGELDEDALFYLRARGLGLTTARQLLTRAFVGELVDRIPHDIVRAHVEKLVDTRLDQLLKSQVEA